MRLLSNIKIILPQSRWPFNGIFFVLTLHRLWRKGLLAFLIRDMGA
jgi:hypothetical protein